MTSGAAQPRVELRPMTKDDVSDLVALAHATGRNVHRSEYERFLDLEGAHGYVLRRDGELEGAVTVMRYFENGFLGPLLLGPRADSAGLALLLLASAVEALQRSGVSLLDAEAGDAEARILDGLGFERVRDTLVLERPPAAPTRAPGDPAATARMEPHHLLDVGALDASAVGHGRKEYLLSLMQDHPEGARVVEEAGEVAGYVLVRRSRRGFHLGPLVTRRGDARAAKALLADALGSVAGWPVVALAPEDEERVALLREAGFQEVGRLTRMRAGTPGRETEMADDPATEWLLGGRITG